VGPPGNVPDFSGLISQTILALNELAAVGEAAGKALENNNRDI
jgi:hypothetical protein